MVTLPGNPVYSSPEETISWLNIEFFRLNSPQKENEMQPGANQCLIAIIKTGLYSPDRAATQTK